MSKEHAEPGSVTPATEDSSVAGLCEAGLTEASYRNPGLEAELRDVRPQAEIEQTTDYRRTGANCADAHRRPNNSVKSIRRSATSARKINAAATTK